VHCACAILPSVACPVLKYFSTLSENGMIFEEKLLNLNCVLIFIQILFATFLIVTRIQRYDHICILLFM